VAHAVIVTPDPVKKRIDRVLNTYTDVEPLTDKGWMGTEWRAVNLKQYPSLFGLKVRLPA